MLCLLWCIDLILDNSVSLVNKYIYCFQCIRLFQGDKHIHTITFAEAVSKMLYKYIQAKGKHKNETFKNNKQNSYYGPS